MKFFILNVITSIMFSMIFVVLISEQKEISDIQDSISKTEKIMEMMIQKDMSL